MTPEKQIIYDLQAAGIVVPSGMGRLLVAASKEGASAYMSVSQNHKGEVICGNVTLSRCSGNPFLSTKLTESLVRHNFRFMDNTWEWDSRMLWMRPRSESVFCGDKLFDVWLDVAQPSVREMMTVKMLVDAGEYACLTIRYHDRFVTFGKLIPRWISMIELRPKNRQNIKTARGLIPKPRTSSRDWFFFKNVISKWYEMP